MIKLTKAEALRIQAAQIEHYAAMWGDDVRTVVAAATTADALEDGVEYDVVIINRHIPRGGFIRGPDGSPATQPRLTAHHQTIEDKHETQILFRQRQTVLGLQRHDRRVRD
jgi:hypothetical protein